MAAEAATNEQTPETKPKKVKEPKLSKAERAEARNEQERAKQKAYMEKVQAKRQAKIDRSPQVSQGAQTSSQSQAAQGSEAAPGTKVIVGNTLLAVCIVLVAFCAVVYLDLFHIRNGLVRLISGGQAPYQAEIDFLAMRQQEMAQMENTLLDAQWNQDVFQNGLDMRELKLMQWEDLLNDRETALADQQEWLDTGSTDLKTMAVTYEKMDPAAAARIMSAFDDITYVKQLLSQMKQATVASILSKMDPVLASQITAEMLQSVPDPMPFETFEIPDTTL